MFGKITQIAVDSGGDITALDDMGNIWERKWRYDTADDSSVYRWQKINLPEIKKTNEEQVWKPL